MAFIKAGQEVGLSLDEIKQALDVLPAERNATEAEWQAMAEAWRGRLEARARLLQRLLADRGECIGCGCLTLADCARQNPDDVAYSIGHSAQYLMGRTRAEAQAADAAQKAKRSL